jgi:hypothetical protein
MLHLPFRRLPACLCGLVARHCPDNGAGKQALWAQRLFGWQRCHRIVPARPRTPGACLLRLGRGTRTALLHLPGRPAPRLTRRDGAVVPRASGEQISTVGSDPGTWETRWPEVCRGWFVCSGIRRQRQDSRRPRHGHGHLCLMQARRGQRGPFSAVRAGRDSERPTPRAVSILDRDGHARTGGGPGRVGGHRRQGVGAVGNRRRVPEAHPPVER